MEATLTREFVNTLLRNLRPLTYLFTFTFSGAPTSGSKFKQLLTANTQSPNAMLTNSVLNSANLHFQTSMRRWKNANESQSSLLGSSHALIGLSSPRFLHQQLANGQSVGKVNTNKRPHSAMNGTTPTGPTNTTEGTTVTGEPEAPPPPPPGKRPRGRPKGSKTKKKNTDAPPKEGESTVH